MPARAAHHALTGAMDVFVVAGDKGKLRATRHIEVLEVLLDGLAELSRELDKLLRRHVLIAQ